ELAVNLGKAQIGADRQPDRAELGVEHRELGAGAYLVALADAALDVGAVGRVEEMRLAVLADDLARRADERAGVVIDAVPGRFVGRAGDVHPIASRLGREAFGGGA